MKTFAWIILALLMLTTVTGSELLLQDADNRDAFKMSFNYQDGLVMHVFNDTSYSWSSTPLFTPEFDIKKLIKTGELNTSNAGTAGQVLSKGSNGMFTWVDDQTGGGGGSNYGILLDAQYNLTNKGGLANSHTHTLLNVTGSDSVVCSGTDKLSNITFSNGDISGVCSTDQTSGGSPQVTAWTNYTVNFYNATSTTGMLVTEFQTVLEANTNYTIKCELMYVGNLTGTAGQFISNMSSYTNHKVLHNCQTTTSATARYQNGARNAQLTCAGTASTATLSPTNYYYDAKIRMGNANANWFLYWRSETTQATYNQLETGSWCRFEKI